MTEALAEAKDLRATMAAERIKAAKQTANLRNAQNRISALRNREIEHVATITDLRKELLTVKAERDTLQKEVVNLRAQTASVPQLLEMVTQVRILETALEGMMSSIRTLSSETAQLKEEVKQHQAMVVRSQKRGSSDAAEGEPHARDADSILVKRGDSLWQLARRYDTTVAEIKTLNNLDGDVILAGQALKIPALARPVDEPDRAESRQVEN